MLSAKDEGHAKAGTIFAGFLKILPVFVLVLPGLIALALYKKSFSFDAAGNVTNGDIAFPLIVINLLPVGLVGLMIAALLAALMGAMSSVFNSASTLVTLDFYKKLYPGATDAQLVHFGRIATGVMVVLGLLWVPFIGKMGALFIYLQSVQGYISPPIAACFVLGIVWPRMNGSGALASLLTGFVLGALRFVLEIVQKSTTVAIVTEPMASIVRINFLHYSILMFVVCALVLVAVSLATKAPARKQLAGLTFATVADKIDALPVGNVRKPKPETARERTINLAFTALLVITVVGLWVYFR